MPINIGYDKLGSYYQFGKTGKKYYYNPKSSRSKIMAYNKALKQSKAIEWSKHNKK